MRGIILIEENLADSRTILRCQALAAEIPAKKTSHWVIMRHRQTLLSDDSHGVGERHNQSIGWLTPRVRFPSNDSGKHIGNHGENEHYKWPSRSFVHHSGHRRGNRRGQQNCFSLCFFFFPLPFLLAPNQRKFLQRLFLCLLKNKHNCAKKKRKNRLNELAKSVFMQWLLLWDGSSFRCSVNASLEHTRISAQTLSCNFGKHRNTVIPPT